MIFYGCRCLCSGFLLGGGDHLILRGDWQIWSGQIIYFQHELGWKIYFQVYQSQNIFFIRHKILRQKTPKQTKTKKPGGRGGGGGLVGRFFSEGGRIRTAFSI